MPVEISFTQTESVDVVRLADRTKRALLEVRTRSVEALERLLREALTERLASLEVSDEAKARFPAFRDLHTLSADYLSCFRTREDGDEFRLWIDRDALEKQGLPRLLPEMLEYGSEIGIPPAFHLGLAWHRFERETVGKLTREVLNELK